ncbi:MAG: ribose 5-phosphate isomerase B [bacterium]|nr:ribose 5-phosphate isomerase B [bacterium]
MKLAIASDHGGFPLKAAILDLLKSKNIDYTDLGTTDETSVDYPDFAVEVAKRVSSGEVDGGILVCGTGIGMAITANKFKGVRAAVITDEFTARMSREHNDANVVALGGRVLDKESGLAAIRAWLEAEYEGGRHNRRLEKIRDLEREHFK